MANRKLANTFLGITALSATTEASGFPKENAVDRSSPMKAWRSTSVAADQRLVIDLGAVKTTLDCYLDYVNVSTIKYQESADGSTGWADITGILTIQKDPMHGVYRRKDHITMTGKRYLGILIPVQAPVDGAAYFRIGTFAVPTGIVELNAETEVQYPLKKTLPKTHIIENRFVTGKVEKIKLSPLEPMVISFDLVTGVNGNLAGVPIEELMNLFRDDTAILYLDWNLGQSWQAYLVKRSGEISGTVDEQWGEADFSTQLFEVVV